MTAREKLSAYLWRPSWKARVAVKTLQQFQADGGTLCPELARKLRYAEWAECDALECHTDLLRHSLTSR